MKTEMASPSSITRYSNNPRINAHAVKAVRASLDQFGWRQPIVVDKDRVIVVGDTRYLAALERGDKKIPIHIATDLTPAQIKAYRLADNKVGELSEWDDDRLIEEIVGLSDDFDMAAFGFSVAEMEAVNRPAKQDTRYLEDFDVPPAPAPKWILISAPADQAAMILAHLKKVNAPDAKIEFSGDKG